jgi:hypothetical protein
MRAAPTLVRVDVHIRIDASHLSREGARDDLPAEPAARLPGYSSREYRQAFWSRTGHALVNP